MTVEQYLALSAVVYGDIRNLEGRTILDIRNTPVDNLDFSKKEFSSLKELDSYKLISVSTNEEALYLSHRRDLHGSIPSTRDSGFYAAAFQSPSGDIIFAFRGTNDIVD